MRLPTLDLVLDEPERVATSTERPFARSPSPQPSPGGAPALEPGLRETESLKFLAYARRQQRFGEQLVFSDIVPRRETNPSTAAQALYHLLCLATKGLVKVAQEDAYGEVRGSPSCGVTARRNQHPGADSRHRGAQIVVEMR